MRMMYVSIVVPQSHKQNVSLHFLPLSNYEYYSVQAEGDTGKLAKLDASSMFSWGKKKIHVTHTHTHTNTSLIATLKKKISSSSNEHFITLYTLYIPL